jgi:hypothetical protein
MNKLNYETSLNFLLKSNLKMNELNTKMKKRSMKIEMLSTYNDGRKEWGEF